MSSKISICIPTYEMYGKGENYLEFSFKRFKHQTYKNFNVIISDHSKDDNIKNLCEKWNKFFEIKYIKNTHNVGSSSSNTNNSIKNADGEFIKILFQDDFLYNEYSLETTIKNIKKNNKHWLASACYHTDDGITLVEPYYPKYSQYMQYGDNTLSSPSVITIKNTDVLEFDENLIWLMDSDFYKRMFDKHGLPELCEEITVVNRRHPFQVTHLIADKELRDKEYNYVTKKYE